MTSISVQPPIVARLPVNPGDWAAELGGKGGALNRMIAAGLPVPATAVVPSTAYRLFAATSAVEVVIDAARRGAASAEQVDAAFLAAPLLGSVAGPVVAAARQLAGDGTLAVRSSADSEDLAGLSFAGQYRSSLHVPGADAQAVLRAVRLTWASLWHPAPVAYRRAWGIPEAEAAMAVVLMRMVPARTAGVVFTADPGGDEHRMRVESVPGLADDLVSGARTPSVRLLPRDIAVAVDEPPMDELRDLCHRAERLFGRPQDVEWAWDGERVWLVQSRPITTGSGGDGCDTAPRDADLISVGVDEMLPGVLPPLLWDLNSFLVEEALRRVFDDVGANPARRTGPHAVLHRIRGRAALDLGVFKEVVGALPGVTEEDLEHEYLGTPTGDRPVRRRRGSLAGDLRVYAARQRAITEAETVLVAVDAVDAAAPDVGLCDDASLVAYRRRLMDLAARAMAAELAVAAAAAAAYARLHRFLGRYLDEAEATLAAGRLTAGAEGLAAAGADASCAVFAGATWREAGRVPTSVPAWPDRAEDRDKAQLALESRLRRHPRWRRTRILTGYVIDIQLRGLRVAVDDAAVGLRRRERTKAAVLAIGGRVRGVHLELGARLVRRGMLQSPGEVDLLRDAELGAALRGRPPARGLLLVRRRWLDRYESSGPLPPRFTGIPAASSPSRPAGRVLHGLAGSGGCFTGPARALAEPRPELLRPGEVLVVRATDASWTPVFLVAGAIVVERGGPLSHAAVVARELGIPAVLDVADAASAVSGRRVTVDGDRGEVVLHDGGDGAP